MVKNFLTALETKGAADVSFSMLHKLVLPGPALLGLSGQMENKNMSSVPHAVILFSPLFRGSDESWKWICDVSNGRWRQLPKLTAEQQAYAYNAGYLPKGRGA